MASGDVVYETTDQIVQKNVFDRTNQSGQFLEIVLYSGDLVVPADDTDSNYSVGTLTLSVKRSDKTSGTLVDNVPHLLDQGKLYNVKITEA